MTCWKSPKIKSQKLMVMTSTSPENSKVWQRSLELSFHVNFKWKLWDLGAMDFDRTGTIGFLVFQGFIWYVDILEKWKFFREITTKIDEKSQEWLGETKTAKAKKSLYIYKKKNSVWNLTGNGVCCV